MTLMELMMMHRRIFSIIDNLHDLLCRGNKDYRQALSNVQDYNMTKILTRKCSIPDKNGDYKEGRCDLDVIYAVQMDIELYNYVDKVLRKLRMGKLLDELKQKAAGTGSNENEPGGDAQEAKASDEAANDDEDDETKKVDGVFAIEIGPDLALFSPEPFLTRWSWRFWPSWQSLRRQNAQIRSCQSISSRPPSPCLAS